MRRLTPCLLLLTALTLGAAAGALVMIPARTRHHVTNAGEVPLFFVTVYAPPAY